MGERDDEVKEYYEKYFHNNNNITEEICKNFLKITIKKHQLESSKFLFAQLQTIQKKKNSLQ